MLPTAQLDSCRDAGMEEDRLPICLHGSTQNHTNPSRCASPASISALADADIRNFAPVARIMKTALPENAKIAKEAKECMQECVSEFISFITSEGETFPVARKFIYLFFISPTSSYIKWFYWNISRNGLPCTYILRSKVSLG